MDNDRKQTRGKQWLLCRLAVAFISSMMAWRSFGQASAPTNPASQPPPAKPATIQPGSPALPPAPAQEKAQPAPNPALTTPPLKNRAAEVLRVEAEAGNPLAQFKLGMLFATGKEAPQDLPLAAAWLRKSAEQGNAAAH